MLDRLFNYLCDNYSKGACLLIALGFNVACLVAIFFLLRFT